MPRKRALLIVEDDKDTAESLKIVLSRPNLTIKLAFSGPEGWRLWQEDIPEVVILDLELPGEGDLTDGMRLLERSRQLPKLKGAKVIVFTGTKERAEEAIALGARTYLIKPGFPQQIRTEVAGILRELPAYSEETVRQTLCLQLAGSDRIGVRSRGLRIMNARGDEPLRLDLPTYERDARNAFASKQEWHESALSVGKRLFVDVFEKHPNVLGEYRRVLELADMDSHICFETSDEHVGLPLELLYDHHGDSGPEFVVRNHPVYRTVEGIPPRAKSICPKYLNGLSRDGGQLRVLLIASNTGGLAEVDHEIANLREVIPEEFRKAGIEVAEPTCLYTKDATKYRIAEILKTNSFNIMHYAGHSSYERNRPDRSGLWFWENPNSGGQPERLNANELRDLLRRAGIQFVFLNSCYGTATGRSEQLQRSFCLGLADGILRAGIPSVLGHQYPVPDYGAAYLADRFYRAFADCGRASTALFHARREVSNHHDSPAWLSPVLLQQSEDSVE